MKKTKWIAIFVILLMVNAGYAQRFKAGVHTGLLATQVDGDDLGGYKKPGVFLGVFGNLPFPDKKIKLQMEINYAQKGSKTTSKDSYRYRIALHQVELPFLFGWDFWKEFSLEAGLSANVIASAKEYVDNELVLPNSGGSKFNLFEIGGIAGLNYVLKNHWGLSFRMGYSLSPIGRDAVGRDGRKLERYMWNNTMLFRLYYQF
ncbi:MAG: PorT family protein [Bacteroidales bacterium]|jgi:hypothetical protein|nr:PorT family protein [Bacteroidales bacterium]